MFDDFEWNDSVGDISNDYNTVVGDTGNWYDNLPNFDFGSESGTDPIENAWNTGNWNLDGLFSSGQDYDQFSGGVSNWLDSMPQLGDAPMASTGYAADTGGIKNTLAGLFNSPLTPLVGKGVAALYEGNQNKKAANQYRNIATSPTIDPFGSQRGYYQQQLKQATQNPNSIPIIKAQVDQLAKAQAIKDAAAGRRSNAATSNPALLAAQAQAAQNYINSLMTPAGANIAPNTGVAGQALQNAVKYDTNSYISPLLALLGNTTKTSANQQLTGSNDNYMKSLSDFLFG